MRRLTHLVPSVSITAGLAILSLIGCSHLDVKEIPASANPTAEIDKLETARLNAVKIQVDVLSPNYFRTATEELQEAKDSRAKAKDSEVILKHVARGQANLDKALEISAVSRTTLAPVVDARAEAIAAEAPALVSKDFKEADQELIKVTEDVESNNLKAANQEKTKLAEKYSQLELRAIKESQLGEANRLVQTAIKEGAKDNASRTLKATEQRIKEVDAYITSHRHEKMNVEQQGGLALASANHLLNVTRQAKVMDNKDAESIVLEREALASTLEASKADVQRKEGQLADVENKSDALASENRQLSASRTLTQHLQAAKAQFSKRDAEVYLDNNKLVVRLKTMAFPTGKANLPPSALAVLGQVNEVIRSFGDSSRITVEGHTDSLGDAKKNQQLSEERAAAIKSFLVASGVDASRITTVGYGFSKPIAANKTKAGRAQNRRVDIIIEPSVPTT